MDTTKLTEISSSQTMELGHTKGLLATLITEYFPKPIVLEMVIIKFMTGAIQWIMSICHKY